MDDRRDPRVSQLEGEGTAGAKKCERLAVGAESNDQNLWMVLGGVT
jgi:hypothetical protein